MEEGGEKRKEEMESSNRSGTVHESIGIHIGWGTIL
jgi:hypothetical protein